MLHNVGTFFFLYYIISLIIHKVSKASQNKTFRNYIIQGFIKKPVIIILKKRKEPVELVSIFVGPADCSLTYFLPYFNMKIISISMQNTSMTAFE